MQACCIISCFSVGVITNDNTDNTDNTRRTLIASHPHSARYNLQLSPCLSLGGVAKIITSSSSFLMYTLCQLQPHLPLLYLYSVY